MLSVTERIQISSDTLDYLENRAKKLLLKALSPKTKNPSKIRQELKEIMTKLDFETSVVSELESEVEDME